MKNIFSLVAVLYFNLLSLQGAWNPSAFLDEQVKGSITSLQDEGFQHLKSKVLDRLKGTWCSAEKAGLIMDLLLLTKPNVCVEVGVFSGSSLLPIAATLKHLNQGKVYAVDGWSNSLATQNMADDDPNLHWWTDVDMEYVRSLFHKMLDEWHLRKYCLEVRGSSREVLSEVKDIDFLHLDGDYSENGAYGDVEYFLPKVKTGGYILFSNFFTMINGNQPKLKAFCTLIEECELICDIEEQNAILFKKR